MAWIFGGIAILSSPILQVILSPLILKFAVGVAAAYLFGLLSPRFWLVPFVMAALGVLAFAFADSPHRSFLGLAFAPLARLLRIYNNERPNMGIGGMTPAMKLKPLREFYAGTPLKMGGLHPV